MMNVRTSRSLSLHKRVMFLKGNVVATYKIKILCEEQKAKIWVYTKLA